MVQRVYRQITDADAGVFVTIATGKSQVSAIRNQLRRYYSSGQGAEQFYETCVEQIGEDVRYAEKYWGTYTVIDAQPNSMTIKVILRAGNRMKYHSHKLRNEVWAVV